MTDQDHSNGNGNGNGHVGPSVIELELTDEMRSKQLVTQFQSSFGSKSVILKLNHKYEDKTIEFYPIETGKKMWEPTLNSFETFLKERGVDEEDRTILRRLINHNSEKIVSHFAQQRLARMTTGQKAKMEREGRLANGPPIELSIKDVLRRHEGNFRVRGMINGLGIVEKMYKAVGFRCGECDGINVKCDYSDSRPRFLDEIPHLKLSEMRCICQSKEEEDKPPVYHELWDDPINALKIVLFDTETFNDLESLNVVLLDDYTRDVLTGEEVIVTGSLQRVTVRGKTLSYLFVGLNPIEGVKNPFEYVNKKESIDLTEDDKTKIRQFIAQKKEEKKDCTELDILAELMAPSILGEEHTKKGLLMAYINSGKDLVLKRRRLNSLLIGDPGLAKSKMLRYMARLGGGNSTFASATDSSAKSLIAVFDNEERILRIGPIPRAHGGICSIDEVGRMLPDNQVLLHSAMEEGEIPWARWAFNIKLPASDTFVLAANPADSSGKLKDALKIHGHEYPLIGTVRDRVDFVFILRKNYELNDEMNYAYEKLKLEENYDEVSKKEEEDIKFLQKIYIMCQAYDPTLSTEARHMLMQYYADVVVPKDSPFSRRLLESLKNACYALAKVKFKDTVDAEDAREVIEFFKLQISQHLSAVVNIPNNPARVGAEEIIDQLPECFKASKPDWIELLDAVCKEDQYVSQYVGFDKEGQRDWSTKSNHKVRKIRKELMRLLPSYKDKILVFTMKPLRLAWKETYTGGDKDAAIDIDSIIRRDGSICEEEEQDHSQSEYKKSDTTSDDSDIVESHGFSSKLFPKVIKEVFQGA